MMSHLFGIKTPPGVVTTNNTSPYTIRPRQAGKNQMIYIIIGRDKKGNEWVQTETFENSVNAAERCAFLNAVAHDLDDNNVYRVDTVEPSEGKSATRLYADQIVKDRLNAEFGRAKMDHEEGYPDTDSINETRTKDFTVGELFPSYISWVTLGTGVWCCKECSALVNDSAVHTAWHNKLLP